MVDGRNPPAPLEGLHKLDPERRRLLVEAALAEIESRGIQDASMNRILENAGLSKGVAYHYFTDRNDLLAAVLRERMGSALSDVRIDFTSLRAESFWEDLTSTVAAAASPARWDPQVIALLRAIWSLPSQQRTRGSLGALWEELTGFFRAALARGQEVGGIRTDLPDDLLLSAALSLGEACDRWMLDHWEPSQPELMRKRTLAMFDLFRRLLSPVPGPMSLPRVATRQKQGKKKRR